MLTIFSTPKPFRGHEAIIQRNAIKSWTLLHPDIEIVLFGDEDGTAEIAKELNLRHEPQVLRSETGMKYIHYLFACANEIAAYHHLCYVNCDIILMSDFVKALQQLTQWRETFLMVGRRWDLNVTGLIDFKQPTWEQMLKEKVLQNGKRCPPNMIDYFVFPKGLFREIPPFLVGRPGWDDFMIWLALHEGIPVVDVSPEVIVIHQNHDYSYHPSSIDMEKERGLYEVEALYNAEVCRKYLAERGIMDVPLERFLTLCWLNPCDLLDSTYVLKKNSIRRSWRIRRYLRKIVRYMIHITRPIRHKIGLRKHAPS